MDPANLAVVIVGDWAGEVELPVFGAGAEAVFCQTENVSQSGMLIGVDRRYEPGTEVRFEPRDELFKTRPS